MVPLRRRGPGPRPATSFNYIIQREVHTNHPQSPTCDNLVSDCPGLPTMSSSADACTGKETATTVDDLAKRFAVIEDLIRPLQPLAETVQKLAE
jgi:hypothetical protein